MSHIYKRQRFVWRGISAGRLAPARRYRGLRDWMADRDKEVAVVHRHPSRKQAPRGGVLRGWAVPAKPQPRPCLCRFSAGRLRRIAAMYAAIMRRLAPREVGYRDVDASVAAPADAGVQPMCGFNGLPLTRRRSSPPGLTLAKGGFARRHNGRRIPWPGSPDLNWKLRGFICPASTATPQVDRFTTPAHDSCTPRLLALAPLPDTERRWCYRWACSEFLCRRVPSERHPHQPSGSTETIAQSVFPLWRSRYI